MENNYLTLLIKTVIYSLLIFSLSSCSGDDANSPGTEVTRSNDSVDWSKYGNNYANHRFSNLQQITTDNVDQLELAWSYKTGIKKTFQTS
ncbi:MAG: hypothetical protein DRQ58_01050, partial [Gammaproteobacteria bacterium]